MYKYLKNYLAHSEVQLLSGLTSFCVMLSISRWYITGSKTLLFLNWNLLLALIPWGISTLLVVKPKLRERKSLVILASATWLLFFPNAPYILTDLFHIKSRPNMPMWFDLVLILSYAWTGLLFGMFSLWHIEKILQRYLSTKAISRISSGLFFVVAFGIYLGRVLRWNSWDVVSHPVRLMGDIIVRFLHPLQYPQTWGMTLLLGIFLNIVYWTFRYLNSSRFNTFHHI